MRMLLRPALKKDLPALKKALRPWIETDPSVALILEETLNADQLQPARCVVLEQDKVIHCAALWEPIESNKVRFVGLVASQFAADVGADRLFLQELILEWAERGAVKTIVTLPLSEGPSLIPSLKSMGFVFEGITSGKGGSDSTRVRLCKHFLYEILPDSDLIPFLRDFLLHLGYEVRAEGDGFGYRIRDEFRFPFQFNPWHRIARIGSDIIVHPPARVLEPAELETLFFPLSIRSRTERPLLIPIERKRAVDLMELPQQNSHQNSLFSRDTLPQRREVFLNALTFTHPVSDRSIRRGLPVVFFVRGLGAVGTARVGDWYLDRPERLYEILLDMGRFDPEDVRQETASSGPKSGKVLVIRYQWYRPFRRVVSLDDIRTLDPTFNAQRTRTLAPDQFAGILSRGNGTTD